MCCPAQIRPCKFASFVIFHIVALSLEQNGFLIKHANEGQEEKKTPHFLNCSLLSM